MVSRQLLSLSLYSLLASNRGGLFLVFLPLYLVEVKGATLPIALTILTLGWLPASLIGPWVGRLSDRVGRRRPFLLIGEAAALPVFLAITFAPGYLFAGGLFVAAVLLLAIGGPAYTAYVADLTRTQERGEGYGLLNATSNAGAVAGFLLAGVVTLAFGLEALFPFVVAIMVGTLLVVVFLVPDVRLERPRARSRPLSELKPVVSFSLVVSVRSIGSGAVATFYGFLAAGLGANSFEVSLVAVGGLLTAAVVSLPLGRLVDRLGEIRGIWYGTVLSLASYGIFLAATTWEEVVPAQAVRSAGISWLNPGMNAWVARMAPADRRAEYLGVFALINSSLWSLGPLAGAVAIEFGGYPGLLAMAIGATLVSLVALQLVYGGPTVRGRLHRPPASATGPP